MITVVHRPSRVDETWRDPEFLGPRGLGCARCHERPPIVWDAGFGDGTPRDQKGLHGALCEDCLARCFPGWSFDRLVDWLGRQREALIRNGRRAVVMKAVMNGDLEPAMEYERDYGVWLLDWRPSP